MHTIGRAPRGQPRASTTTALAWAIWGNATNDVWAAECSVGYLGHYDGTGWNHLNSQDGGPAIWGSGTSDVWLIDLIGGDRARGSAPPPPVPLLGVRSGVRAHPCTLAPPPSPPPRAQPHPPPL